MYFSSFTTKAGFWSEEGYIHYTIVLLLSFVPRLRVGGRYSPLLHLLSLSILVRGAP